MKKELKIIKELTNGNKGSLTLSLNAGTENSLVMGEVLSNGLSTIHSSKAGSTPLKKGLNFTSFIAGLVGTFEKIIPAPAYNLRDAIHPYSFNEVTI